VISAATLMISLVDGGVVDGGLVGTAPAAIELSDVAASLSWLNVLLVIS
jgi:hypothetical protein